MRHLWFMVALVGVGMTMSSAPAFATDQAGAIKLCAANPQCGLVRSQGGVNLWVDHPGGGESEVWCPDQGECVCVSCGGVARKPGRFGADIGFVIRPRWGLPGSLSEPSSGSTGTVVSAPAPANQPPIL